MDKSIVIKKINMLQLLPAQLIDHINFSEFKFDNLPKELVRRLEKDLNCFIVPYKRSIFRKDISINKHLCANIKGKSLSLSQIDELHFFEQLVKNQNTSFVVYEKPYRIIDIKHSPFFN